VLLLRELLLFEGTLLFRFSEKMARYISCFSLVKYVLLDVITVKEFYEEYKQRNSTYVGIICSS
jgi:hypothetical protein